MMCGAHGKLRKAIAHNLAVFIGRLGQLYQISVLILDNPLSALIDTGIFPHVEVSYRLSCLYALESIA